MKEKIVGILVMTLLIASAILPVIGTGNVSSINEKDLVEFSSIVHNELDLAIDSSDSGEICSVNNPYVIYEGLHWQLTITVRWDPPNPEKPICLRVDTATLPAGATFPECVCGYGEVSGVLDWTPSIGQAGTYQIVFYVGESCYDPISYFTVTVIVYPYEPDPQDTYEIYEGQDWHLIVTAYWVPPQEKFICLWVDTATLPYGATFVPECHCDYGQVTSDLYWTPYVGQAGEYIITFYAGETCGEYVFPFSIRVIVYQAEQEPPRVVIEYPPDEITFTEPDITLTGLITDDVGIVTLGSHHEWGEDESWTSGTVDPPQTYYPFEWGFTLREGWNRITIYASDNAGYSGEDDVTIYYMKDTTPPTIDIITPTNAIYLNDNQIVPFIFPTAFGSITIEANAYDGESGIKLVEFYIDGEIQAGDTGEPYLWKWGGTYFGTHTIKAIAYDYADNYAECYEDVIIINWNGATTEIPRPIINKPVDGQTVGEILEIDVIDSNDVTDISYCKFSYFDETEWYGVDLDDGYIVDLDPSPPRNEWSGVWNTESLVPKYYLLRVEMENSEGYIGYDEITVYVTNPPTVVVDVLEFDLETGGRVFDASESYDPDGSISEIIWTFWTYPDITTMEGEIVEYEYLGDFVFTIEIIDDLGTSSRETYWVINDTAETKFAIEAKEIDNLTANLTRILTRLRGILNGMNVGDPGYFEVTQAIQRIEYAVDRLSQAKWWLEEARWWQSHGNEENERLCIQRAKERIDWVIDWLSGELGAITILKEAMNEIVDEAIKRQIEEIIEDLALLYMKSYCIEFKIWLLDQIGPTTHGAGINIPGVARSSTWGGVTYGEGGGPGKNGPHYADHRADGVEYCRNEFIVIPDDYTYYPDVILHELDHHMMHKKNHVTLPGGAHSIHNRHNRGLAWSEGWASFSACAKQGDNMWTQPNTEWNMENGTVRYGGGAWINIPSNDDCEGAVAGILWDLFDGRDNTDGDQGDNVQIPFKCIWKAINNHSDPNSPQESPEDIRDFYLHLVNVLRTDPECIAYKNQIPDIIKVFSNHGVNVP